jgi:hypothetical protein
VYIYWSLHPASTSSQVEGKLVEINIRGNVADLAAIDGDLVCEHARSRDLNGVWPIVVVVAQSIGEVEDRVLRDVRGVLSDVEVSGLDCTLGDWVRHEEEVKSAINNLWLLDESVINIGSLGRVENLSLVRLALLLEESLSHALIDDDECDVRKSISFRLGVVLVSEDLLELIELVLDDLLSHWITDSVTIDEDLFGECALIEVSVSLQGTAEVLLKNVGGNNFLALLTLRACLGVVLAHILIVCSNETNNGLFSLVANIDTNKHGLVGDLSSEVHSPEITTELGIDLSHNVQVDAIVVTVDGLGSDELRDNGVVRVNFIFNGGVEMLLSQSVWDDDKEELDNRLFGISLLLLSGFSLAWYLDLDVVSEVGVDCILEVFNLRSIVERNNITVVNEDIESILLGERVELVLEVFTILDILLEAEDSPLLEVNGLADDLSKNVGVIESLACWLESTLSWGWGEHENAGSLEDLGLDLIGLEVECKIPLFDLSGIGDLAIQVRDTLDAVIRLLEQALSDVGHDALVLSNLRRDSNQDAELWWQKDALLLLFNFEERLVRDCNPLFVIFQEVVQHPDTGLSTTLLSLLKVVGSGREFPTDSVDLVGSLLAIVSHDDCAVKIAIYILLIFKSF